jgi:hypothetical protein
MSDNSSFENSILGQGLSAVGGFLGNAANAVGSFLDQQVGQRVANIFKYGTLQNKQELNNQVIKEAISMADPFKASEMLLKAKESGMISADAFESLSSVMAVRRYAGSTIVAGPGAQDIQLSNLNVATGSGFTNKMGNLLSGKGFNSDISLALQDIASGGQNQAIQLADGSIITPKPGGGLILTDASSGKSIVLKGTDDFKKLLRGPRKQRITIHMEILIRPIR